MPGFSRPPSLAELAVAKQTLDRREEVEIIVSGSKQESREVVFSSSGTNHHGYCCVRLWVALATMLSERRDLFYCVPCFLIP